MGGGTSVGSRAGTCKRRGEALVEAFDGDVYGGFQRLHEAVGLLGLRAVLEHPWLSTLPTYLETPGMDDGYDDINLERARMLVRGEELPDLPAAAFAARPGRRMRKRRAG